MPLLIVFHFIFTSINVSPASEWFGYKGCGLYRVRGIGRSKPQGLKIIINEKSNSEIIISLPITNEVLLAPYVDKDLTAKIKIFNTDGSTALAVIKEIDRRIPKPIDPKDTGIEFLEKSDCHE